MADRPLSQEELLAALRNQAGPGDTEGQHQVADRLLIEFINDPEIAAAYEAIHKWYA